MRLIRHLDDFSADLRGGSVSVGNFDGVHLGHARIIDRLLHSARAKGGPAIAFTFDPHPAPSNANGHAPGERMGGRGDDVNEAEPGLGGVAFLQNGRSASSEEDPAVDDQPEVPAFTPPAGRRGG